jgi:hypothetical protein
MLNHFSIPKLQRSANGIVYLKTVNTFDDILNTVVGSRLNSTAQQHYSIQTGDDENMV